MISSGQLRIPSHVTVLHVEQEVIGDETPALQSVLEADVIREGLLKEEKDLTSRVESGAASAEESSRLTEVFQSLEAIDSAKAPARAAVILSGEHLTTYLNIWKWEKTTLSLSSIISQVLVSQQLCSQQQQEPSAEAGG